MTNASELPTTTDRDELVVRLTRLKLERRRIYDVAGDEVELALDDAANRIRADAATIARMREALVQAREAMSDGDPYKDVARQMIDAALKGGDHG